MYQVRLLSSLSHNNVLQFKEWYETTHNVWVITELASGGSLSDLLAQDGYITLQAVPGFVKDIAAGLRYVHSHNIIYCDLQPEKVSSVISTHRWSTHDKLLYFDVVLICQKWPSKNITFGERVLTTTAHARMTK